MRTSLIKYIIGFILAGIVFWFVAVFLSEFIEDLFIAKRFDPEATQALQEQLALILRVGGIILAFLLALSIYLSTTAKTRAHRLASQWTANLSVSQEEFETLYDLGPVPYVLISPKGNFEKPNKSALHLFGATAKEIENASFFDRFVDEEEGDVKQVFEKFRRNLIVHEKEIQFQRKDDAIRWVLLSIFPLEAGPKKGYGLATMLDVTERKQIEKAKTEFVSLAAHQLRTPLATIRWYSDMLTDTKVGPLNEKQEKYANKIHKGSGTMTDLVNTLLNISRLELGRLQITNKETNLEELMRDVLDELSLDIEKKKEDVVTDFDSFPQFITDPKLLRIVFQNLVSNAVKYTSEGGKVTVTIKEHGTNARIVVVDTGIGIPAEDQNRIFSKMFRAENARKKVSNGNGLGLYMTKAIVESLGGNISFTSKENEGTTFEIKLPQGRL